MHPSERPKLLDEVLRNDPRTVGKLINKGANFKTIDDDGNTLLHIAAREGHLEVVEKLLQRGPDKSTNNNDGLTARALAKKEMYKKDTTMRERYREVIELLDHPPVYSYSETTKSVGAAGDQLAPQEADDSRVNISKHFQGYILHWFENRSKEAECPVYDIIYEDALERNSKALQAPFDKDEDEKAKKEEMLKTSRREDTSRKREDAVKEKSKKTDKIKNKQRSNESGEGSASKEGVSISKANTWIHLPANNVRQCKTLHRK
jgi:hypothetical protein